MGANVVIEHNGKGWIELFKSAEMQSLVDSVGERIAGEAGEHFTYHQADRSNFTAAGFVNSDAYSGAYQEATDKVLTKAVHP